MGVVELPVCELIWDPLLGASHLTTNLSPSMTTVAFS